MSCTCAVLPTPSMALRGAAGGSGRGRDVQPAALAASQAPTCAGNRPPSPALEELGLVVKLDTRIQVTGVGFAFIKWVFVPATLRQLRNPHGERVQTCYQSYVPLLHLDNLSSA